MLFWVTMSICESLAFLAEFYIEGSFDCMQSAVPGYRVGEYP